LDTFHFIRDQDHHYGRFLKIVLDEMISNSIKALSKQDNEGKRKLVIKLEPSSQASGPSDKLLTVRLWNSRNLDQKNFYEKGGLKLIRTNLQAIRSKPLAQGQSSSDFLYWQKDPQNCFEYYFGLWV